MNSGRAPVRTAHGELVEPLNELNGSFPTVACSLTPHDYLRNQDLAQVRPVHTSSVCFKERQYGRSDQDENSLAQRLLETIAAAHDPETMGELWGSVPKFAFFSDRCTPRTTPDKQSRALLRKCGRCSAAGLRSATSLVPLLVLVHHDQA